MPPCGSGAITLEIGVGDPFIPTESMAFTVDQGNQGGYHVDVSLKIRGDIDPDNVDVDISILYEDLRLARHRTNGWLLKIFPDAPHCEFARARVVFTDLEGDLLELEEVEAMIGREVTLAVDVDSPLGGASERFPIQLSALNLVL